MKLDEIIKRMQEDEFLIENTDISDIHIEIRIGSEEFEGSHGRATITYRDSPLLVDGGEVYRTSEVVLHRVIK